MFIAMNRFKVRKGEEPAFETRWRERDTHLHTVPGFVEFHLLKGPERDDHVLYASHTIWRSHADFEAWTRSEAFRAAHRDAGQGRSLTISHPEFEGFEVIQTVAPCRWPARRNSHSVAAWSVNPGAPICRCMAAACRRGSPTG
jgi:heme-degrading monooxygenase HmoA